MKDTQPSARDGLPAVNRAAQLALNALRLAYPNVSVTVTPDCIGDHATEEVPDLISDLLVLVHLSGGDVEEAMDRARSYYREQVSGTVVVRIDNSYECGHTSSERVLLTAPGPGTNIADEWADTVFGLGGDPHGCGAKCENATCTVEIVDAPDRPELVGWSYGWEG